MKANSSQQHPVTVFDEGTSTRVTDSIAVEAPLEIRLSFDDPRQGRREQSVSITMRTPGNDVALALGFLFSESIIDSPDQIQWTSAGIAIRETGLGGVGADGDAGAEQSAAGCNVVTVSLSPGVAFDPARLQRNFYTTSSCGVCAKSSLEAIRVTGVQSLVQDDLRVGPEVLETLPETLLGSQSVFSRTGGLHAAGLFDRRGSLLNIHEDVGRHNAVDKLIGDRLQEGTLPAHDILMVSGRTSFEIVQKALRAGIPFLAAVSAPSTLALALAREFDMTLVGFLRGRRFNVYCGARRLSPDA